MEWRILSFLRLRFISALFLLTIAALPSAFAENGRDFSAIYNLKNVAPVGANEVSVTLSLRLQNHSGGDISDAEVSLQDSVLAFKTLGVFPIRLNLANHEVANLSGTFIVPTQYVQSWRAGQKPRVVARRMNAQGRWISRPVELLLTRGMGD